MDSSKSCINQEPSTLVGRSVIVIFDRDWIFDWQVSLAYATTFLCILLLQYILKLKPCSELSFRGPKLGPHHFGLQYFKLQSILNDKNKFTWLNNNQTNQIKSKINKLIKANNVNLHNKKNNWWLQTWINLRNYQDTKTWLSTSTNYFTGNNTYTPT